MKEAQRQEQLPLILSQDTIKIHSLDITKMVVNVKGVDRTVFSTFPQTPETCARIALGIDTAKKLLKDKRTIDAIAADEFFDADKKTPEEYVRQRTDFFVSQLTTKHGISFFKANLAQDKYGLNPLVIQNAYERLYEDYQRRLQLPADRSEV